MAKQRRPRRRPWIVAGLIVLILGDVFLIAWALWSPTIGNPNPSPVADSLQPAPSATIVQGVTPSPDSSAPASTKNTAVPPATTGPDSRLLAFSGDTGYRATRGSCGTTDALIEKSSDGGATWATVNPSNIHVREINAIALVDSDHIDTLAVVGDACTKSDLSSYTGGEFWQLYPDKTSEINEAEPSSDFTTPDVYANTQINGGYLTASFGRASCSGVSIDVVTSPSSADFMSRGCLSAVTASGPLAIATSGETVWIWAGDKVFISRDTGSSWKSA